LVLVLATFKAGLLPPDPACAFMLLLQSCMPPGGWLRGGGSVSARWRKGWGVLATFRARLLPSHPSCAFMPLLHAPRWLVAKGGAVTWFGGAEKKQLHRAYATTSCDGIATNGWLSKGFNRLTSGTARNPCFKKAQDIKEARNFWDCQELLLQKGLKPRNKMGRKG
jgi:hypothetical protein